MLYVRQVEFISKSTGQSAIYRSAHSLLRPGALDAIKQAYTMLQNNTAIVTDTDNGKRITVNGETSTIYVYIGGNEVKRDD